MNGDPGQGPGGGGAHGGGVKAEPWALTQLPPVLAPSSLSQDSNCVFKKVGQ